MINPVNGFVGVDMGIVNIATTATVIDLRDQTERLPRRQVRLRKRLQAKETSSARRLLKKRRRKEARFAANVNHKIAKRIVTEAQRTGRGIAVEDLTGIRDRVRLRKPQRATLSHGRSLSSAVSWPTRPRDPGWRSSRSTPPTLRKSVAGVGWVDKRNRRSQSGV